jgi:hypothetical protein
MKIGLKNRLGVFWIEIMVAEESYIIYKHMLVISFMVGKFAQRIQFGQGSWAAQKGWMYSSLGQAVTPPDSHAVRHIVRPVPEVLRAEWRGVLLQQHQAEDLVPDFRQYHTEKGTLILWVMVRMKRHRAYWHSRMTSLKIRIHG